MTSPSEREEDPLERWMRRAAPEVPPDAAERALAGLQGRVDDALWWGEVEGAARRAARPSLAIALLGAAALVLSLAAAHLHGPAHHLHHDALDLTEASGALADLRRLADPFTPPEKKP